MPTTRETLVFNAQGHAWSPGLQTWVDRWGNFLRADGTWSNEPAKTISTSATAGGTYISRTGETLVLDAQGHGWSSALQTWVDRWGNYQLASGRWSNEGVA